MAARSKVTMPQAGSFKVRAQALDDVIRAQANHVLLIEPVQFVGVEHGVATADSLERELLDQFRSAEYFLIAATR